MHPRERDRESGVIALAAAILMVVLIAFLALAMNAGLLMRTRTELQTAADSAALAAAKSLDGTSAGWAAALAAASAFSRAHISRWRRPGDDAGINAWQVLPGRWHFKASECVYSPDACFEPVGASDYGHMTAVKVVDARNASSGNGTFPVIWGGFLGTSEVSMSAQAIAIGNGTGSADCAMPFVLPSGLVAPAGTLSCESGAAPDTFTVHFNSNNVDQIGFVGLNGHSPSDSDVATMIGSPCPARGYTVVDSIDFHNGNNFNKPVRDALQAKICASGDKWTFAVMSGSKCGTDFNSSGGDGSIIGFVQVQIVRMTDNHGDPVSCGSASPFLTGAAAPDACSAGGHASPESLTLKILCDRPPGSAGGRVGIGNRLRLVK